MRIQFFFVISALLLGLSSNAQNSLIDLGFEQIDYEFKTDKVQILIKTKRGEERKKKPLFLFIQGSLPRPLGSIDKNGQTRIFVFPFKFPEGLLSRYHIAVISKPYIPAIVNEMLIGHNHMYIENPDDPYSVPNEYIKRDYLDYYVRRNLEVVRFLQSKSWIDNTVVVAGHSQGSTIAVKMAANTDSIDAVIFSGGNPLGRIMSMIAAKRRTEPLFKNDSIPSAYTEGLFEEWEKIVSDPDNATNPKGGDSNKSNFQFSQPVLEDLLSLNIPIFVTYGTKG